MPGVDPGRIGTRLTSCLLELNGALHGPRGAKSRAVRRGLSSSGPRVQAETAVPGAIRYSLTAIQQRWYSTHPNEKERDAMSGRGLVARCAATVAVSLVLSGLAS